MAVGATGGHIMPGMAVAEELKALDDACEVVFAGTDRGRTRELVSRAGYSFIPVLTRGWAGVGAKGKVVFIFLMAISLAAAFSALLRERPHVVVGTGSYATLPFAISALFMDIPMVLLEQNVMPGTATRFLSRFAREVHVAYEATIPHISKRTRAINSGNPVRRSLLAAERNSSLKEFNLKPNLKTVLVFGGSRGARSINSALVEAASALSDHPDIQFIVQTGEDDLESVREACERAGLKAHTAPFIHEMEKAYACADIVVCRAGATTLAELTALGLPCILIPYPFSVGGHQEKNAMLLQGAGAAVVIRDCELTGELLASRIVELLRDEQRMERMAEASEALGRKDAGRAVARSVLSIGEPGRCSEG